MTVLTPAALKFRPNFSHCEFGRPTFLAHALNDDAIHLASIAPIELRCNPVDHPLVAGGERRN